MEEFGKILRAPSLKRGKAEERISDRIKLEKVLGVTVASNAALASDSSGTIAYPAGCTVVLFNTKTAQQHHIINTSRKTITSLAFSSCDRYLVTGECGHQPAVRVWDLYSDPTSAGHPGLAPQPQQICEFTGHKYGVNCVAFSPSGKYVVSVGTQHDMIVNVWDWKSNVKVASNKVSTKVKAVAFAENGNYFVTVGNRHVKFWYLEYGRAKYKEAVPLMGRSAILGEQRNNYFCDVACGKAQCGDSTYAITRSGLLCEFNNRRLLDKWVELRTTSANCITVGENYIFVGCAEGIIRCFDPATLCFITTLPRTHYLGVDISLGNSITHMASPPPDAKYPDTVAITYSEATHKLTSVYNDHSVYVWDVFNIKRVGKSFSFLYHSACIWGVEMAPPSSPLPAGSFLTCSSDDTIRVWTLDKLTERTARGMFRPNVYSNELLKVVYVDKDLSYIKDLDLSATNSTTDGKQQGQDTSYDGRNGVRCIRVSPDGKHLASGDRSGNIRVHDTATMRELCKIEAHDAEVLCLEYQGGGGENNDVRLMASASRDRLLHVFDVKRGYEFMQTLDDHSSSITAVRFLANQGNVQMVSCGADKSVIFRSLEEIPASPGESGDHHLPKCQFVRDHNATGKTTLYDMEVDAGQKHVITACQDRNVRIYSCNTGKHTKSFKGSTGDDGTLIKVVLDRSGIYLASSCTDKSLSVYDYYSGECMATMCGHSELATGLRFTNDCKRLISASGDGCIFVWRVPHDMVVTMHARLSQQAMRQGKTLDSDILSDGNMYDAADANYRFSIGPLPQWARKQLSEDTSPPSSLTSAGSSTKNVAIPKGRWAQRASESTSTAKSWSAVGVIPPPSFPALPTESSNNNSNNVRFDSDGGSKDSSLEETHRTVTSSSSSRETHVTMTKQMVSSNITLTRGDTRRDTVLSDNLTTDTGFESTAHDGDIDSDNEYRQRPLYYPTQVDSASGSEFTVTNIDADELRKSQRRSKKSTSLQPSAAPQILIQQPSLSTYGSQDSDDDEDEASTPSGDNTDRNPLSLFSVSSESLDQLVTREKYLQSTFESMDAAGNGEPSEPMTSSTPHKSSISSKFLTRTSNGGTSDINQAAINAVKQTKSDPEALKKRQLLSKRIAETKKKLESVGHSSPLKYSQSIHDLSHVPERDKWNQKKQVYLEESSPDSSLRRSCSLSDLSMQKPVVSSKKIDQVSGMKRPQTSSSHHVSRPSSRYTKNTNSSGGGGGMMTRSRSSGVLNQQSDSENETADKKVSRLMRPTISSHNKINNKTATLQQRKKQSYSTSNLNTVGTMDGISTSDDDLEQVPISSVVKPTVPPRTRQTYDLGQQGAPQMRRHLNNKESKPLKARHTIHFHHHRSDPDDTLTNDDIENANRSQDLSTVEISHQLCDEVIQQLTKAADNVLELYNRLSQQTTETSDGGGRGSSKGESSSIHHHQQQNRHNLERTDMVKHLEMSILQTHKVFHDCIFRKLRQTGTPGSVNGSSSSTNQQPQSVTAADVNQTDTVKKLHDLVSKGSGSAGSTSSVVNMMEQYSDILWEMAQQKIHGGGGAGSNI